MSEASELIAQQILNATINKKNWGQVLYNVKVFGAKGDGIYDDTQAVQDTIDTALFNGASLVYFPPGSYKVTSLINTSRINFVGDNAVFIGYDANIVQLGGSNDDVINVKDYGVKGDGVTDDTEAIQGAIDATPAGGTCYIAGTLNCHITSTLFINQTINLICDGYLSYSGVSGAAVEVLPSPTPSGLYNCFIKIANLQQVGGNTGMPTSINTSGAIGLKVNSLISSRIDLGSVMGFTYAGVFLDGLGEINSNPQVIAHNLIDIRTIANCGVGLLCLSLHAATSNVEVNDFRICWLLQNYICVQLDNATTYGATSSNLFHITAMDNSYFHGFDCYGSFNYIVIAFSSTSIVMQPESSFNTVNVGNNEGSDCVLAFGGIRNRIITAMVHPGSLPATVAYGASGTVLQNTYGVPITVYLRAYATVPATAGFIHGSIGETTGTMMAAYTQNIGGDTTLSNPEVLTMRVPSGWYYKFESGGATLGNLSLVGE